MLDTNPKDAIGKAKPPHGTVSLAVLAELGVAMAEGARKYGRHNYRAAPVEAMVYYDATRRHLDDWVEGEDIDPDSGISHLTKAIASLCVLRDAMINGMMIDDRPPKRPAWHKDYVQQLMNGVLERLPEVKTKPYTQTGLHPSIFDHGFFEAEEGKPILGVGPAFESHVSEDTQAEQPIYVAHDPAGKDESVTIVRRGHEILAFNPFVVRSRNAGGYLSKVVPVHMKPSGDEGNPSDGWIDYRQEFSATLDGAILFESAEHAERECATFLEQVVIVPIADAEKPLDAPTARYRVVTTHKLTGNRRYLLGFERFGTTTRAVWTRDPDRATGWLDKDAAWRTIKHPPTTGYSSFFVEAYHPDNYLGPCAFIVKQRGLYLAQSWRGLGCTLHGDPTDVLGFRTREELKETLDWMSDGERETYEIVELV